MRCVRFCVRFCASNCRRFAAVCLQMASETAKVCETASHFLASQAEGRRFEPGLPLWDKARPRKDLRSFRGFVVELWLQKRLREPFPNFRHVTISIDLQIFVARQFKPRVHFHRQHRCHPAIQFRGNRYSGKNQRIGLG